MTEGDCFLARGQLSALVGDTVTEGHTLVLVYNNEDG